MVRLVKMLAMVSSMAAANAMTCSLLPSSSPPVLSPQPSTPPCTPNAQSTTHFLPPSPLPSLRTFRWPSSSPTYGTIPGYAVSKLSSRSCASSLPLLFVPIDSYPNLDASTPTPPACSQPHPPTPPISPVPATAAASAAVPHRARPSVPVTATASGDDPRISPDRDAILSLPQGFHEVALGLPPLGAGSPLPSSERVSTSIDGSSPAVVVPHQPALRLVLGDSVSKVSSRYMRVFAAVAVQPDPSPAPLPSLSHPALSRLPHPPLTLLATASLTKRGGGI